MKNHGLSIPFYIQVAEYRIRIEPKYDMVQKYCKQFIFVVKTFLLRKNILTDKQIKQE